ncbi:hypothetical protein PG2049B_0839 [Bifidobacterium pseudolongum subsp. globosum]|uniref:Autotransporter adhesin n=1 Tax=Bifidobacterium pseudolongum subsp. globosum TaxID=1690 RepID=A0A4Q5AM18_9BIFI|nr:hypothetical protein [Bifidobacterium pseudolongum]RYQ22658.1 hypothetical protein PG2049B_0839 [Bifidobacterium pseudolongum subsp. globosum]RYQ30997.1 hypothetical protein PG2017B_0807 [Bifidobacterium pseudolongum subsp. globosum]
MAIHEELNPDDAALPFMAARANRLLGTDNAARTAGVIVVPNRDGSDTVLGVNGVAPWVGDTTPPGKPLDIEATSHLGTALIRWGGELEGGVPSDFRCVQIWAKQVDAADDVKTLVGVLSSAGEVNTGVFDAGTTLDVWATALDNAHDRDGSPAYNESVESEHVQVEILPIVSQQEFDEAADNILAAADESVKAQIERVDTDLAATNEAIDRKAGETLAAANAAAEANLSRVQEEIAGEGGKIDQAANSAYERAKEYTDALKTSVDDDLESITHKINTTAEDTLFAAKQDTAKHIEQVNKDIAAANQKIDDTAAKTLADANKAAAAQVAAVDAKVATAQEKADANAAAIAATNKTVEANKQAADEAQKQLNQTMTEHGSVLESVNKDITQAKKDILANAATAAGADSKAGKAQEDAAKANAAVVAANKTAADAAEDAASAKQDAAEAAGIANGKADVLIQSTAPSEAMRKTTTLWIDTTNGANTPKRWNGSAWVAVTDKRAVDAANAAAAAQTTADNAQTTANEAKTLAANADAKAVAATATANNAQTTADSKNTVYMQATDPHDEADKASLIVPGDLWWQTSTKAPETYWTGEPNNSVSVLVDHSDEIEHMWVWNGTRWNRHVLYAQDMLVNGSIVAELLAVDCVEARHISVGAIEADKLAATALYGKVIKGGTFLTANERLIINDAGLLLKDSGGNATITMLAGDGSATFRDVLIVGGTLTTPTLTSGEITGGTISGATVTGGTVQTVNDAHKGIKLTGGNLDIYRADQKRFLRANESGLYVNDGSKDVLAFFNDAGTWKLKLTGPVTSGGEISGATVTGGTVQTSAQADTGIKLVGGNLDIYRNDQSLFMRANESGLLLKDGERTVLGFSRVLRTYWEGEPNNSVSVLSDGWQLTLDGAIQSGGEITGAVITGGTVQTNAAPNKGLKLKDNNLDAYMSSGTRFLRLNEAGLWFNDGSADVLSFTQSDGSWKLRLTGAIQAGGAISGATVTGSTVQTTASANRGVKLYSGDATTGNLDVYRADGQLFFRVNENGLSVKDSDTNLLSFAKVDNAWKLSLKGAIQSGGEISGAAITGAVIRTNTEWQSSEAAKKYRGLVITDGGMFAYKNNGKEEYSMAFTAATGELKLDGAISTNAVFNAPTISAGQMVGTNIYTSTDADNRVSITSAGLTVTHGGHTVISFAADGAVDLGTSGIAADSRVSDLTDEVHDSYTPLATFTQTTDALGESVTNVQTQVGATADRLDEEIDARKQYMQFDPNNGLTIGDLTNTDAYSVQLTSTAMQFRAGNTVAAYVSNDRLYINNAEVVNTLRIGNFAFLPRDNGHMSLQYVGGSATVQEV